MHVIKRVFVMTGAVSFLACAVLALPLDAAPAFAVEQCRFIQPSPNGRRVISVRPRNSPRSGNRAASCIRDDAIAGADEARGRGAEPAAPQHLPGMLTYIIPSWPGSQTSLRSLRRADCYARP